MRRKQFLIALCAGAIAGAAPLFLAMASIAEPPIAAEALSEAVGELATKQEARYRIDQFLQKHSMTRALMLASFGLCEIVMVAGFVWLATGIHQSTEPTQS
ncbi:MAG: hypothetical protein JSS49_08445 [Planctomycetes bacterium]|nr:hypothetical protein [Planctomycetota bacterium]